jgi:hypothetical protein
MMQHELRNRPRDAGWRLVAGPGKGQVQRGSWRVYRSAPSQSERVRSRRQWVPVVSQDRAHAGGVTTWPVAPGTCGDAEPQRCQRDVLRHDYRDPNGQVLAGVDPIAGHVAIFKGYGRLPVDDGGETHLGRDRRTPCARRTRGRRRVPAYPDWRRGAPAYREESRHQGECQKDLPGQELAHSTWTRGERGRLQAAAARSRCRAINVQLATAPRGLTVTRGRVALQVRLHLRSDGTNSQADSAGPIPGERLPLQNRGRSDCHRGSWMSAQAASHSVLTVTRMLLRAEGTGGQNQK